MIVGAAAITPKRMDDYMRCRRCGDEVPRNGRTSNVCEQCALEQEPQETDV